jgi:hypothetical protein
VTLWQKAKLSKTNIAETLTYRKEETLRMINNFKQTFGFDLSHSEDLSSLQVHPMRLYPEFMMYMGRKHGQSLSVDSRLLSVLKNLLASKNHNSAR